MSLYSKHVTEPIVGRTSSKAMNTVYTNTSSFLGSKRIKRLTSQLDELTKKVTTAAITARKNPLDSEAEQHLNDLRKEWQSKVKELTAAIDEIINVTNFTAATG